MACSLARSVGSALERHRQWLTPPASHPREVRVEVYPRKKRWKRPLPDAAGAKGIPPTGFSVVRFSAALIKGPRFGLTLEPASPAPVQSLRGKIRQSLLRVILGESQGFRHLRDSLFGLHHYV